MFKRRPIGLARLTLTGLALSGLILAGVGPTVLDHAALATEPDAAPEFRSAKTAIQQLLRSKKPNDRIEALGQLEKFPAVDAAKLAVVVTTKDESTEVREAA